MTTDQRSQVHAGNPVEITLPGSTRIVRGRVGQVGTVATAPTQDSGGNGGNGGDGGPATVNVTIDVIKPGKTLAGLDLTPVQVAITARGRGERVERFGVGPAVFGVGLRAFGVGQGSGSG